MGCDYNCKVQMGCTQLQLSMGHLDLEQGEHHLSQRLTSHWEQVGMPIIQAGLQFSLMFTKHIIC